MPMGSFVAIWQILVWQKILCIIKNTEEGCNGEMACLRAVPMNSAKFSASKTQSMASQLLREISMSNMCSKGIDTNAAFVSGANCRSAVATIIHLVATKSIEGAVTVGLLQNISTSFAKVMRYSQIAKADSVVSAYLLACRTITYRRQHISGHYSMYCDVK